MKIIDVNFYKKIFQRTDVQIFLLTGVALLLSLATIYWGKVAPIFILNENRVLYLFSTSAQVLAGVYGLTLAGFIFFRNELSQRESRDDTLVEAVDHLKSHYFWLFVCITVLVLLTFAFSNIAISSDFKTEQEISYFSLNIGQSLFATSLIAIACFIFGMTRPKSIISASQILREQIDPSDSNQTKKGSLEQFIRNYNEIERLLNDHGKKYDMDILSNDKQIRHISNSRLAEILVRNERISSKLYVSIKNLITLRNSIVHGADPVVSQNIVITSESVLQELRTYLNVEVST